MRKLSFSTGEMYHVYNRGVDKRNLFKDRSDLQRFVQGMVEFNVEEPIGSIYEQSFRKRIKESNADRSKAQKLVDFICYCVNPNHYHFLLRQRSDDGISKFMKRLGGGYSWYFNNRHERSGTLFQGPFKAVHVGSNEYLLHLSVYVNLNDRVHLSQLGDRVTKLGQSSWKEYTTNGRANGLCNTDIILGQFRNRKEYIAFAYASLQDILQNKESTRNLEAALLLE